MGGQRLGLLSKQQKQRLTNKEFLDRIGLAFDAWRRKKGKANTIKNFLEYLIRHNFFQQHIINRWVCLDEYAAQIEITKSAKNPNGIKQHAIWAVEELLPLGETQIKSNLCHHSTHFKESYFKFP